MHTDIPSTRNNTTANNNTDTNNNSLTSHHNNNADTPPSRLSTATTSCITSATQNNNSRANTNYDPDGIESLPLATRVYWGLVVFLISLRGLCPTSLSERAPILPLHAGYVALTRCGLFVPTHSELIWSTCCFHPSAWLLGAEYSSDVMADGPHKPKSFKKKAVTKAKQSHSQSLAAQHLDEYLASQKTPPTPTYRFPRASHKQIPKNSPATTAISPWLEPFYQRHRGHNRLVEGRLGNNITQDDRQMGLFARSDICAHVLLGPMIGAPSLKSAGPYVFLVRSATGD